MYFSQILCYIMSTAFIYATRHYSGSAHGVLSTAILLSMFEPIPNMNSPTQSKHSHLYITYRITN